MKDNLKSNRIPFSRRKKVVSDSLAILFCLSCMIGCVVIYNYRPTCLRNNIFGCIAFFIIILIILKQHYKWNKLYFAEDGLYKEKYKWFQTVPYEKQLLAKWREVRYIELISGRSEGVYRSNVLVVNGPSPQKSAYIDLSDYESFIWSRPNQKYDNQIIKILEPICRNNNIIFKLE